MSQARSFKNSSLENQIADIERELTALKAIQQYSPSQINYSYYSNSVDVTSYLYYSGATHYGINASFIFTSRLKDVFPRTILQIGPVGSSLRYGVIMCQRSERLSKNQVRMVIQLADTVIPMDSPYQFSTKFTVASNTVGTLELEKTYVLPSPS